MQVARAARATFALGIAMSAASCSTGPAKGNSGFYIASGTCSGTPLPCGGLSGAACSLVSGCTDFGSCSGVASTTGESCGARTTFTSCSATMGCVWQANCSGQPLGNCSAITAEQCTNVPGCVWTPYSGTGGFFPDAARR